MVLWLYFDLWQCRKSQYHIVYMLYRLPAAGVTLSSSSLGLRCVCVLPTDHAGDVADYSLISADISLIYASHEGYFPDNHATKKIHWWQKQVREVRCLTAGNPECSDGQKT